MRKLLHCLGLAAPINPSSPIVTLMCMKSLRRDSLGLIASNPPNPSATPNHVGISAVECSAARTEIPDQTKRNQQNCKYQSDLCQETTSP